MTDGGQVVTQEPDHARRDAPIAARVRGWIDLDGTLVGGEPYFRLAVRLPRWVGLRIARKRGYMV